MYIKCLQSTYTGICSTPTRYSHNTRPTYNRRQKCQEGSLLLPQGGFNVEFLIVNRFALFIAGEANIEWGEGEIQRTV